MAIGKVGINISIPNTASSTGSMAVDSESKNLQNRLTSEKQRLKQVSSDSDMSVEEKEKERRKIQQQIAELNRKLRMKRIEQEKEAEKAAKEQEQKEIRREELLEEIALPKAQDEAEHSKKSNGEMREQDEAVPVKEMQIMFSADSLLQQARVRESVDREKKGIEGVLEAEIQLDTLYGTDIEAKKEELVSLRKERVFQFDIQAKQSIQEAGNIKPGAKIIIQEN